MKKRVLVTGVSGTVGYEVLKQLIDLGQYHIRAFDVETPKSKQLLSSLPQKYEMHFGDITRYDDVEKAARDIDFVIHLAAIIPPLADENPTLAEAVNVKGTQNLIRSLEKHSPKAFFVYSSSISVYGDRVETPHIQVSDPLEPSDGDEYAMTKIKCETLLQSSGLSYTIFRLAAIMGNHKISKLMFEMPLSTAMEICTPSDTARAFVNALKHTSELNKRIFNLGGGEGCRCTYEEFLALSFKIFGLGALNFPPKAFAEKNFHCGWYRDGHHLEEILHFRQDDLSSYFSKVASENKGFRKTLTQLFRPVIKRYLLSLSEPYRAYKNNDTSRIQHFFN